MIKKSGTPMDAALKYLETRARSTREMELHLDKCEYGEYEIYQVVERLKELGYLNDAAYAADFVRTRLNTKPVSRRKLREQLAAHHIAPENIAEGLLAVTDEVEAKNAAQTAQKFARQFAALPEQERRERVLRRLCARGYDYATVRESVAAVVGDFAPEEFVADAADAEETL